MRKLWHLLVGPPVRAKSDRELLDDLCDTFNDMGYSQKGDLMERHGDLYITVARLAARVEAGRETW